MGLIPRCFNVNRTGFTFQLNLTDNGSPAQMTPRLFHLEGRTSGIRSGRVGALVVGGGVIIIRLKCEGAIRLGLIVGAEGLEPPTFACKSEMNLQVRESGQDFDVSVSSTLFREVLRKDRFSAPLGKGASGRGRPSAHAHPHPRTTDRNLRRGPSRSAKPRPGMRQLKPRCASQS